MPRWTPLGRMIVFGMVALIALESWLFLEAGKRMGLLPILAWVFFSFALGLVLIRVQGVRLLFQMHIQLQRGTVPAREIAGALALLLGGVLLMLPGFFSDALGALLLFPPTRALLWLLVARPFARTASAVRPGETMRRPSEEVIELRALPVEDEPSSA